MKEGKVVPEQKELLSWALFNTTSARSLVAVLHVDRPLGEVEAPTADPLS